jgi:hypothetical protein
MSSWRTARGEIRTLSIRPGRFRRMPAHRPAKSEKIEKSSLRPSSKSDWMVVF